jgi:kynurenine formamidase
MKIVDLTHTFSEDMPVYPGDPIPELLQIASIAKEGYTDYKITTGMHVGTHMDAPLHMLEGGKKLSEIEPQQFIGRGILIDAREKNAIDDSLLATLSKGQADIVLVMTGFYKKFRSPEYYTSHPEITESFAQKIISLGIKMVGIDTPSPDRPPFKVHKLLLGNDILIVENLTNLEQLLGVPSFEVLALPAKFDAEAAPVRVLTRVE